MWQCKTVPAILAVVKHLDPKAVLLDSWQEWDIDLREFSDDGVDLTSVEKMYIGVGNRTTPQMGGTGRLFFDDIRLYRPRCLQTAARSQRRLYC